MNEARVKAWLKQAKSKRESNLILAALKDAFKEGKHARQKEVEGALIVLGVALLEE